ncbi:MAG: histone deacetylase [Gemmatimonadetes bacterium]|nr:histone deacetylase [Gemmatimonadota bacterium]MCC7323239.1 histone deacetylase [Gemmatimonadaceae bacterium]
MSLHAWTSARYVVPLPPGHRFPIEKYERLRQRVLAEGLVASECLHEPPRVTRAQLLRVHTPEYVDRLTSGTMTAAEVRRLGFPWSPDLVERSLRAVGGTCEAVRTALELGVAMNLAGGTHHAFATHGEGFCVFNDVAVAIREALAAGRIARAAIIDLDVHQGNGTHAIFADEPHVFTFSMHGGKNYPFHKVNGDLDIELDDGTGDDEYLARLHDALPRVLAGAAPDLVVYLAGADPHEGDRLGRLALTFDGLARRDAMVLQAAREVGIPVAITIAGGYGRNIEDTVEVHCRTVRVASGYA